VGSKGLNQACRVVQQRHPLTLAYLIALALICALASCSSSGGSQSGSSPSSRPTGSPTSVSVGGSGPGSGSGSGSGSSSSSGSGPISNPFGQFDQNVARLVKRQAIWQVPKQVKVQRTARVGLVIGDVKALRTQIKELVPGSFSQSAGQVKVGSTISVELETDPSDASVTPKDAIDQSTGEHTALLWTWFVRATHPNSNLLLTAVIVVMMSDGLVLHNELALSIPVGRTWQYTFNQIFTNWATWLSIATALSGALVWIWGRRKRRLQTTSIATNS
jgi:hypothetical protein